MSEKEPVPVKVVRAFAGFPVGHIIPEMPPNVRKLRVARGYVTEDIEAAPVDRAMRSRRGRRRGS